MSWGIEKGSGISNDERSRGWNKQQKVNTELVYIDPKACFRGNMVK